MSASFVAVEVEPGPGCDDGLSLRFKRAGEERAIASLRYESERGTEGEWSVCALSDAEGAVRSEARAVQVDDSSEGLVWLVYGGRCGLMLTHDASGEVERVPYLVLARV